MIINYGLNRKKDDTYEWIPFKFSKEYPNIKIPSKNNYKTVGTYIAEIKKQKKENHMSSNIQQTETLINSNPILTILAERGNNYGSFDKHAQITQALKTILHNTPNWKKENLTPSMQESLEMVMHKIGRILNGDPCYLESWRDIVGYVQLVMDELAKTEGATDGRVVGMKVINGKLIDIS